MNENVLVRYNIFHARLLINHAENGKKYLYDILAVKRNEQAVTRCTVKTHFLLSIISYFSVLSIPYFNFSKYRHWHFNAMGNFVPLNHSIA